MITIMIVLVSSLVFGIGGYLWGSMHGYEDGYNESTCDAFVKFYNMQSDGAKKLFREQLRSEHEKGKQ